jgi:hypothetical protein
VRKAAVAIAALLVLASCGERAQPDDQGLHQDIVSGANGAEVTFDATILTEPVQSGGHERFEVKDTTGENLEIDHNITLAAVVPAHMGDPLIVHGRLYIDPGPRIGVHCTHASTSSGCPDPGWIEFAGNYYE